MPIQIQTLRLQRALLPNEAPFVPGIATRYRRLVAIEHDRLLGTDRALPAPIRRRPARHSIAGGRLVVETYPWFIRRQRVHATRIGTLPVADRDHDCPPPLQTLSGRGSLRSALIAASWCRSSAAPLEWPVLPLPRVPKSPDWPDSGRSAVSAGTSLDAPKPTLPGPIAARGSAQRLLIDRRLRGAHYRKNDPVGEHLKGDCCERVGISIDEPHATRSRRPGSGGAPP